MAGLTKEQARKESDRLYLKYCSGDRLVNNERTRKCIQQECRAAERGKIQVSRGLLTELRAERKLIAQVITALNS